MERKRKLRNSILKGLCLGLVLNICAGCSEQYFPEEGYRKYEDGVPEGTECEITDLRTEVCISFGKKEYVTKTGKVDEKKISDINLVIFSEEGLAEEIFYLENGEDCFQVNLLKDKKYGFFACANFGNHIKIRTIEDLDTLKYRLSEGSLSKRCLPMYSEILEARVTKKTEIRLQLLNLMAKISLRMDRSRLSDGVTMKVTGLIIGNCPGSSSVMTENSLTPSPDCLIYEIRKDTLETEPLNFEMRYGISDKIDIYMPENIQGLIKEPISSDAEKIFDKDDPRRKTCSFIELYLTYNSPTRYTDDKALIYRFYLGETREDLNVERNCHYNITICPEDDGLSDDGWRVDKTGLLEHWNGEPWFAFYPGEYIVGHIGDKIHIWCEFMPKDAPFDIGMEELIFDHENGIYDYEIDKNGHGVTLTLTKAGTGIVYMEVGEPVNEVGMAIIVVLDPSETDDTT